jgi:hypothetical protein
MGVLKRCSTFQDRVSCIFFYRSRNLLYLCCILSQCQCSSRMSVTCFPVPLAGSECVVYKVGFLDIDCPRMPWLNFYAPVRSKEPYETWLNVGNCGIVWSSRKSFATPIPIPSLRLQPSSVPRRRSFSHSSGLAISACHEQAIFCCHERSPATRGFHRSLHAVPALRRHHRRLSARAFYVGPHLYEYWFIWACCAQSAQVCPIERGLHPPQVRHRVQRYLRT